MKRILAIFLVLAMLFSLAACTKKDESADTANPAPEASADQPAESGDGEKIQYVHIEVVHGTTWWNTAFEGMKQQADFYGDIDVDMVGPVNKDAAEQIQLVEDQITKGVDVISIVPIDVNALEPVLKKARDNGIIVVVQESPTTQNRDLDVEMQDDTGVGQEYIENLVAKAGDTGGYAIFVDSLTSTSHMTRAQSIMDYAAEHYPNLELVCDPIPNSDVLDETYANVCSLLQTYPNLIGICGQGDSVNLAIANALKDKGREDIANVGMASPEVVADILKEGRMEPFTNFISIDNGIVLLTVARWLALGNNINELTEIENAGESGAAPCYMKDGSLFVNARYTVTAENVDDFLS